MPFLRKTTNAEVVQFSPLTKDEVDLQVLIAPPQNLDVDEFLYKLALLQCEDELSYISGPVYALQMDQALLLQGKRDEAREWESDPSVEASIINSQEGVARVQTCILENLIYERQTGRSSGVLTGYTLELCSFARFQHDATELEYILAGSSYRAKHMPEIRGSSSVMGKAMNIFRAIRGSWRGPLFSLVLLGIPLTMAAVVVSRRMKGTLWSGHGLAPNRERTHALDI